MIKSISQTRIVMALYEIADFLHLTFNYILNPNTSYTAYSESIHPCGTPSRPSILISRHKKGI